MFKRLFLLMILVSFFQTIYAQGKVDTLFRFAHVSDTHIGASSSIPDLQATIADINNQTGIAFVIITGDITEFGSDEEFQTAKRLLDQLNKPWYIVPGNHDTKWSESGANSFQKIFGSETFSFEFKGFLFMGTSCGPNMRMGPGQVPRENLLWMDSVLKKHPDKSQPIFFVNHYPMTNGLNNWYEVLDRFRDRNLKAVLCGHGHTNEKLNFEGVPGIMGRSNLRAKDSTGAYNIVSITSGSIVYNERKPGIATLPAWNNVAMVKDKFPVWNPDPPRPDYSMNNQYRQVKEKWMIQENADIGSGVGFYNKLVIYTTTDGWIKGADAANGKVSWSFRTGGKLYATPMVMESSVIVPCTDGNIYCLNARDGKKIWTFATNKPIVSSAAGYKDRVIIAGSDGHCRALDLKTGKLLWDYDKIDGFVETRPLIEGGTVYFGTWANEFYAFDIMNGKLKWKWSSGQTNRMFSPAACWPVISGDQLFIVAPDRYATVLNKNNGSIIWRDYDSLNYARESIGISKDKKQYYIKTTQGKIQAVEVAAGKRKLNWVAKEELGFDICPSPINEYNDVVFVPSHSGVVYALKKDDGNLLWKHKISNCLVNTIQAIDDHTVVASTMDGKLVCLGF